MKKIVLILLVILIGIQFIRPDKNIPEPSIDLISKEMNMPEEIEEIVLNSCADCHSDQTAYPWYAEIAPLSWYIASHVNDGKKHLNFTQWANYNKNQKSHIVNDLEDELTKHKMPLKSYLILHKNATLTELQYQQFLSYVATLKSE